MAIVLLSKNPSETPLEAVERFRKQASISSLEKICYAGRLDPIAAGLMVLLTGEPKKQHKSFESFSKTYLVEVLFGVSTDTGDAMGLAQEVSASLELDFEKLQKATTTMIGSFEQPYPAYSSKSVQGHPLFWWARNNRLSEISIPSKKVTIERIACKQIQFPSRDDIVAEMISRIQKVNGLFRQDEIIHMWSQVVKKLPVHPVLFPITVTASSGTYMRSLAQQLGEILSTPAIAYTITRTSIGPFTLASLEDLPFRIISTS
jgi:tRNA pseudouridine55 synthase